MANHLSFDVLSRVVERRASAVEEAKAQRHLASCGRCRSELEWLQRIRSPLDHTATFDIGSDAGDAGWRGARAHIA